MCVSRALFTELSFRDINMIFNYSYWADGLLGYYGTGGYNPPYIGDSGINVMNGVILTSIPHMTSNTLPNGTISSSNSSTQAYFACDGLGDFWTFNNSPSWIQYQFPEIIYLYSYTFASVYSPLSWNLSASNDGVSFTTLDSRTNINPRVIGLPATHLAYSYYRLTIQNIPGHTIDGIDGLQMYGYYHTS